MSDIHTRLRDARIRAGFRSARAAAIRYNWPKSTYSQHERGARKISAEIAEEYARKLGVSLDWLMKGQPEKLSTTLTVSRALDARWRLNKLETTIDGEADVRQVLKRISSPGGVTSDAFAFVVETTELTPFYRMGDILIADKPSPPIDLINHEVVAETVTGELFLGTILPGGDEDRFHIISPAQPLQLDAPLRRAWPVTWIRKAAV